MEELLALRRYIEQQRYTEALDLLAEMEEMSREDKVNKIYSFAEILLLHLIKQRAEQRTTRSWDLAIRNAARHIARVNKRYKSEGTYLSEAEYAKSLRKPIILPWNVPLSRLLRVVMTMWNWGKRWTEQLSSRKHCS
jgi:hypothetical protein